MHGIFVGEIQALEGAGRTAFDYDLDEIPFALKLDMARQCWDEARHVEISIKLGDHMGTDDRRVLRGGDVCSRPPATPIRCSASRA